MILLVDANSQYTKLISSLLLSRCGVDSYTIPFDLLKNEVVQSKIDGNNLKGIVISGSSRTHSEEKEFCSERPKWLETALRNRIPILGICYGMHWLAGVLGGKIGTILRGEYGRSVLNTKKNLLSTVPNLPHSGSVLAKFPSESSVWMSHKDSVTKIPKGFVQTASTEFCSNAVLENFENRIHLVQFHPEVKHTELGELLFRNFLRVCGIRAPAKFEHSEGPGEKMVDSLVKEIRSEVGGESVLLAVSGGVDSSVLCRLLAKALPGKLHCVFVDNGLLRKGEREEVESRYKTLKGVNFVVAEAADRFFNKLKNIEDPERKRKIIGEEFIRVFEDEAAKLEPKPSFFAQGTIYPDVIESLPQIHGPIKSHHNVGGLPESLQLKLLEPLKGFFKDQVRILGSGLGLEREELNRQPFPGPGLAIRVLGAVTKESVRVAREADSIFIGKLRKNGFLESKERHSKEGMPRSAQISQAFAALLPVKAVGIEGDRRKEGFCAVLRAVCTTDFMTASVFHFPEGFLEKTAADIIASVPEVARVFFDVTSKPPGTIELE